MISVYGKLELTETGSCLILSFIVREQSIKRSSYLTAGRNLIRVLN